MWKWLKNLFRKKRGGYTVTPYESMDFGDGDFIVAFWVTPKPKPKPKPHHNVYHPHLRSLR